MTRTSQERELDTLAVGERVTALDGVTLISADEGGRTMRIAKPILFDFYTKAARLEWLRLNAPDEYAAAVQS